MFKRLFGKFSRERERGVHKATVRIDFFPDDLAVPQIVWHQPQSLSSDIVVLGLYFYARILYELAEQNETRVAKELMAFVDQVRESILGEEEAVKRPLLPLGSVHLGETPNQAAPWRRYQADFYEFPDGSLRLDFQAGLGKEGFYLPAAFLAFLQSCLNELPEEDLKRLITVIGRLHAYYRYRKDFWDGAALFSGPAFALSAEEIAAQEEGTEA
jgi:hypothetical protein